MTIRCQESFENQFQVEVFTCMVPRTSERSSSFGLKGGVVVFKPNFGNEPTEARGPSASFGSRKKIKGGIRKLNIFPFPNAKFWYYVHSVLFCTSKMAITYQWLGGNARVLSTDPNGLLRELNQEASLRTGDSQKWLRRSENETKSQFSKEETILTNLTLSG